MRAERTKGYIAEKTTTPQPTVMNWGGLKQDATATIRTHPHNTGQPDPPHPSARGKQQNLAPL